MNKRESFIHRVILMLLVAGTFALNGGKAVADQSSSRAIALTSAIAKDSRTISLSWQVSHPALFSAYRIYRRLADSQGKAKLVHVKRTLNKLDKGQNKQFEIDLFQKENTGLSYQYLVSAIDVSGSERSVSNSIEVTLPHTIKPRSPIGLGFNEVLENEKSYLAIGWQPVADAQAYRIYRRLNSKGNEFALLATVKTEKYQDHDIHPSTAYRYRISSVDEFGNESTATRGHLIRTTSLSSRKVAASLNSKDAASRNKKRGLK